MYNSCTFLDLRRLIINVIMLHKQLGQQAQVLFFLIFLAFFTLLTFCSPFSYLNLTVQIVIDTSCLHLYLLCCFNCEGGSHN